MPAGRDPLRTAILLVVVVGMAGTGAELVLLEHWEDPWQWVPLVGLGGGLLVVPWLLIRPGPAAVRVTAAVMAAFVVMGALGLWRHYAGNVEFELEMYPSRTGLELFREAMMGATPALAPGAMIQLGLLGLACCWRHPRGPASARGGRR